MSNNSGLHNWSPSKRFAFSFQLIRVGITLRCVLRSKRNGFFVSFHLKRQNSRGARKREKKELKNRIEMSHWIMTSDSIFYLRWTIADIDYDKETVRCSIVNAVFCHKWFGCNEFNKILFKISALFVCFFLL